MTTQVKAIHYRGFSIEQELDGTFTAYGYGMYDRYSGFTSVEAAKTRIDRMKD